MDQRTHQEVIVNIRRIPLVASLAAALLGIAGPADAAASPAPFGEHVVHCAQTVGFSGTHNPGVHHQGFSNWHEGTC